MHESTKKLLTDTIPELQKRRATSSLVMGASGKTAELTVVKGEARGVNCFRDNYGQQDRRVDNEWVPITTKLEGYPIVDSEGVRHLWIKQKPPKMNITLPTTPSKLAAAILRRLPALDSYTREVEREVSIMRAKEDRKNQSSHLLAEIAEDHHYLGGWRDKSRNGGMIVMTRNGASIEMGDDMIEVNVQLPYSNFETVAEIVHTLAEETKRK